MKDIKQEILKEFERRLEINGNQGGFMGQSEPGTDIWEFCGNRKNLKLFLSQALDRIESETRKEIREKLMWKIENTLGITISDPNIAFEFRDGEYKAPKQYISKDEILSLLKTKESEKEIK